MKRPVAFALALCVFWVGACGGFDAGEDGANANVRLFCEKSEECGQLGGLTLEECIEEKKECTDRLSSDQTDAWNEAMDACAELEGCDPYFDCWTDVDYC